MTPIDVDALIQSAIRAFNSGLYTLAERLCGALPPDDARARDLLARIPEARRERLLYMTHKRRPLEQDAFMLNDLTPGEWEELIPVLARIEPGQEFASVASVHRTLDTLTYDYRFVNTDYEYVLDFIRDATGLEIVLEGGAFGGRRFGPVTVRGYDLSPREALRRLLEQLDPSFYARVTDDRKVEIRSWLPGYPITDPAPGVFYHEVNVAAPGEPVTNPPPVEFNGFEAMLAAARVDLDIQNAPISAIVHELATRTGLTFELNHDPHLAISFKASQESLRSVLKRLLEPRGMIYSVEGVTIRIDSRDRDPDRY